MSIIKQLILIFLISLGFNSLTNAQNSYIPLNKTYNRNIYKEVYSSEIYFHTSINPFNISRLKKVINYDSLKRTFNKKKAFKEKWKQKAWNKIFNDDVVGLHHADYDIVVNPLMDFDFGYDFNDDENSWVNTRGFEIKGRIGKNLSFYTNFYENQAAFVNYVDKYIRKWRVVPGQGGIKGFGDDGFDYAAATGYLALNAGKYFSFQFGHGKNFIGDGYRSLLLSDNAFNNLFLKATVDFWHIKYMVLYNQYIDIMENRPEIGHPRKYSAVHYLSWAISKRINLSFFDAVIWQATDSAGMYRGFDLQYLNPIIFMRPLEFSIGSPDNALMGLNLSVIVGKHNVIYGQLILDEFKLSEVTGGEKWWGNKQGFQLGFKTYDPFCIKNLYLQTEYNWVRPYTYSQRDPLKNYGHYNQPLAHPLGANFWEWVNIFQYNHNRLFFKLHLQYALYGEDPNGKNYGKDIFKSYETRDSEYGNHIGQGIKTTVFYNNINISYLINPAYNLNFSLGFTYRYLKNDLRKEKTSYIYFALRTSLNNLYYNF